MLKLVKTEGEKGKTFGIEIPYQKNFDLAIVAGVLTALGLGSVDIWYKITKCQL